MTIHSKIFSGVLPVLLAGMCMLAFRHDADAQKIGNPRPVSNPFESRFFINRYLGNPAMAGLDSLLHLNAAYRRQMTGIPGAPVEEAFSADYNTGKRVGLGLIVKHETAALIDRTRLALSYAYHLPIDDQGKELHFGLSAALSHAGIDPDGIVGTEADPSVAEFNNRKNIFDVDYGMAYTNRHVTLQFSMANLIGFFKTIKGRDGTGTATAYASVSYKFLFEKGTINSIEPLLSVQSVKNDESIAYAGANMVMFHRLFNLFGMVHTSGSVSTGFGLNYKNFIFVQGAYLTKTKGLRDYTNGNFEVDLTISLFGKKK